MPHHLLRINLVNNKAISSPFAALSSKGRTTDFDFVGVSSNLARAAMHY